ncbi:Lsr2 family protein [Curtobacterium sp. MCLR17_032]|uniref:histone-like nucleoid-structuring protein Lsr2 n=1 Tax=Curtobacterium sp. MCLR17_032 TaxID=2175650 RepID=UPI000DA7F342|nr:Lsr2 family protein [Curtobacterium sp. MCLR17_032]WIE63162.1 Lsr2 family protein [Curtobacterium sp. MCLR17_032]
MAQKITTTLVDDLTGETIEDGSGKTVQFGFDGSVYEIDLTNENADKTRGAYADHLAAARKTTGRSTRTRTSSSGRTDPDELAKIREWAAANGLEVAAPGRISQAVRDAYAAAQ